MQYIACENYSKNGLDKFFDIKKGSLLEEQDGVLAIDGGRVCYRHSNDSVKFFARNDDGKGKQRFKLTREITRLAAKAKADGKWDGFVEALSSDGEMAEFIENGRFGKRFFEADIEPLQKARELLK